jgi:hypothetical protein
MVGDEQGKPGNGEKMLTIPERVLQDYVKQVNETVRKYQEAGAAEREKLRGEFDALRKRPLKDYAEDFSKEMVIQIQEKLRAGAANSALAEILPEEIKKQRGLIADLTREEVRKQAPEIVGKVIERKQPDIEQLIANGINKIDGAQPATIEQTIERKRKRKKYIRWRNRILGGVAAAIVIGGPAIAIWYSSKRTAEGAAGTANAAISKASITATSLNEYRTADEKRWIAHNETKTKEDDARAKATGELEKKLTGEIAKKSDKTFLDAQIADLRKDYTDLDAAIKAELAKNKGREDAYTKYKELADATKTSLDDLGKRFGDLEGKAATKEYADEELAKVRKNLADADANIKKYGGLVVQLQKDSGANTDEAKRLAGAYEIVLRNYQAIAERVKKLEEKPKENSNYKPLERDR